MSPADILAFERQHPRSSPARDALIRSELGMTEFRYAVLLARAAASLDGIAADPITARRVRARADARERRRMARMGVCFELAAGG